MQIRSVGDGVWGFEQLRLRFVLKGSEKQNQEEVLNMLYKLCVCVVEAYFLSFPHE